MTVPRLSLSGDEFPEGVLSSSERLAIDWGISPPPWLWGVRLRILFVTDGRITAGYGADEFGLGLVLDTLRDPAFAWWVRFEVDVVDRDTANGFRFTKRGFDIDDYDQVWFFGDWPGEVANDPSVGDGVIENESNVPLDDDELLVVAKWMERGGGVFATGDHAMLGASICYRIPRVRTMRKWTRAQGVPSFSGEDRHETLQPDSSTNAIQWEGDRYPQPIFPVYQRLTGGPPWGVLFQGEFPHPLLCGRVGAIDRFPDHMHEGAVIEDEAVELTKPLDIPGYAEDEYPLVRPVVATSLVAGSPAQTYGLRPHPHVIAHAMTTHKTVPERFPLIGVYDGDPAKIGRVVVDSTWHHWFSMNLVGLRAQTPGVYKGMQDYYRNVGLWLATPEQRAAMLFAATWGILVGKQPGALSKVMGIWDIGALVLDAIGRTAPQCIVSEFVATFVRPQVKATARRRPPQPQRLGRIPPLTAITNQAIVGGIAMRLLDLAHQHIEERALGRETRLDGEAVRRQALAGVADGQRELAAALNEGASAFRSARQDLEDRARSTGRIGETPIHADLWRDEMTPE